MTRPGAGPEARRVVLHVGLPKTGTTYLQAVLAHHRDALEPSARKLPASPHARLDAAERLCFRPRGEIEDNRASHRQHRFREEGDVPIVAIARVTRQAALGAGARVARAKDKFKQKRMPHALPLVSSRRRRLPEGRDERAHLHWKMAYVADEFANDRRQRRRNTVLDCRGSCAHVLAPPPQPSRGSVYIT